MVQVLDSVGWIAVIADKFAELIREKTSIEIVLFVCLASTLGCVLLNNQPMTILFTKILLHPQFACAITEKGNTASMYALIMGSNFGANFALNGALAGLMWAKILRDKQVHEITFWRFMRLGSIITLPAVFVACAVFATFIDLQ
jgi:Na+/H+ antiporter NhaD/arsenite permease-like protein